MVECHCKIAFFFLFLNGQMLLLIKGFTFELEVWSFEKTLTTEQSNY